MTTNGDTTMTTHTITDADTDARKGWTTWYRYRCHGAGPWQIARTQAAAIAAQADEATGKRMLLTGDIVHERTNARQFELLNAALRGELWALCESVESAADRAAREQRETLARIAAATAAAEALAYAKDREIAELRAMLAALQAQQAQQAPAPKPVTRAPARAK